MSNYAYVLFDRRILRGVPPTFCAAVDQGTTPSCPNPGFNLFSRPIQAVKTVFRGSSVQYSVLHTVAPRGSTHPLCDCGPGYHAALVLTTPLTVFCGE